MVALTASAIVCYFIPTVTDRFIVVVYTLRNRVWQQAFERLERLEGKLSRAVLRGREVSNGLLLPDLLLTTNLILPASNFVRPPSILISHPQKALSYRHELYAGL
jgi:hypothetical protein